MTENNTETVRYTDTELAEFKTLILDKLKQAEDDYQVLKNSINNTANNGTEDTAPTFKPFEDGSIMTSREDNAKLAARQERFIRDLKFALERIENKTYGICRQTGKLIQRDRLLLVPHATLSIEAKNDQSTIKKNA